MSSPVNTDTTPPLVSVIMIFHNEERFLDEAISSVLAQTYTEVELLLVDDGSSDRSSEIAAAAARSTARPVTLLHHEGHENRGMSASRNLGIRMARGELTAFLDGDDYWEPGHLEGEVTLYRAHPAVVAVCGSAVSWRSWEGAGSVPDTWAEPAFSPGTVVEPPEMQTAILRNGAYATTICNLLVRTATLREVGGGCDEFTGMYEDQVLLAKLFLNGSILTSGARTARYRQHRWSSSVVAEAAGLYSPGRPNESRRRYLRWLDQYVADHSTNRDLRAALEAELTPYRGARIPLMKLESTVRRYVPRGVLRRAVRLLRRFAAPTGRHTLRKALTRVHRTRIGGDLAQLIRPLEPTSRDFGFGRGQPVDRYYIERFLADHRSDIAGRVLEVGDDAYSQSFGGDRVTHQDVLHVDPASPNATIVGDLARPGALPPSAFNCIVLTQTLHLLYDVQGAVDEIHDALAHGGVLLLTVPGVSAVDRGEWREAWAWSFTEASVRRLLDERFGRDVEVRTYGNLASATGFLRGRAAHELSTSRLDHHDEQFPVVVAARARKRAAG